MLLQGEKELMSQSDNVKGVVMVMIQSPNSVFFSHFMTEFDREIFTFSNNYIDSRCCHVWQSYQKDVSELCNSLISMLFATYSIKTFTE